jgi:glutathione S-transferase
MKLYYAPGACSLAVHIALREALIDFQLERVDPRSGLLENGQAFRDINPRGYVPVLELHSGERLTEVVSILQFIAHRAPAAGLMPPLHTMAHTRAIEWLAYTSSELHKGFGPLFDPSLPAAVKAGVMTRLQARLSWADEQLVGKTFLVADEFTIADAYLFAILGFASVVDLPLTDWPSLQAFAGRMMRRPAVQQAMAAEGLLR